MGTGASTQVKAIDDDKKDADDTSDVSEAPVAANIKGQTTKTQVRVRKESVTSLKKDTESSHKRPSSSTSTTKKEVKSFPSSTSTMASPSKSTAKISHKPLASSQTELEMKLSMLEKQLAESESEKLDLVDHIQALEERLQELASAAANPAAEDKGIRKGSSLEQNSGDLQETLKAKDHYIQQIEQQLASVQADSTKVRVRLKKKIKNLTAQLTEAKQESSIAQLELKERNAHLQDKLRHSKDQPTARAASPDEEEDDKESKLKVILDLSAEVSSQAERIAILEKAVTERDEEIIELRNAAILSAQSAVRRNLSDVPERPQSDYTNSTPRKAKQGNSSRSVTFSNPGPRSRPTFTPVESRGNCDDVQHDSQRPISKKGPRPTNPQGPGLELSLQRQSTALSDSDSDWEIDGMASKIHSAPARVRVKSAASVVDEKTRENPELNDKWSLATDDNDLTMTGEARPVRGNSSRQKRRSALKTKLERERNERSRCLMGPSLAFAHPVGEQLTDTSCTNTPSATPRTMDNSFHLSTTDVMTFAV